MSRYWRDHLWLPLLLSGGLIALVERSQLDLALAGALYRLEGGGWALRHHWLLEAVLHDGLQDLSRLCAALLVGLYLVSWLSPRLASWRAALGYLLASLLLSVLLVGLLKQLTDVACPWSLQLFGGDLPYTALFDPRPAQVQGQRCFPAGHVSAAYGWIGIYYLLRRYRPRWRRVGLLLVMLAGVLLGGVQQLRGAHFLSHDLWTLSLCWSLATVLNPLLLPQSAGVRLTRGSILARLGYTGGAIPPPP